MVEVGGTGGGWIVLLFSLIPNLPTSSVGFSLPFRAPSVGKMFTLGKSAPLYLRCSRLSLLYSLKIISLLVYVVLVTRNVECSFGDPGSMHTASAKDYK